MISATLVEAFATQYGHGIKVRLSDGQEKKAFGKGPPPQIPPGTPVTFNLNQKGRSYYYSNLQNASFAAAVWPAPPHVPQSPYPERPFNGPHTPPLPTIAPEFRKHDANERMIFITGVVGRAMTSGQFGISDIVTLTLTAADAYDALQTHQPSSRAPQRAVGMDEPPPPQGEGDYGGDAPPEW